MELKTADLYRKHDQLINLKRKTYHKLYERCLNTIKLTGMRGDLICIYEIPSFMFGEGFPIINIESCANYIMNTLAKTHHSLRTTFFSPNIIFIDWRREEDM